MKRILIMMMVALCVGAAQAQFSVGMRDTRYLFGAYTFHNNYTVKLEESIYSEKPAYQYFRVYAGYTNSIIDCLSYTVSPYYGMAWNNGYRNFGVLGTLEFNKSRWGLSGTINPHYDSGFKYKTLFRAGVSFDITRHIGVLADYSTIGVYREEEKRVGAGFQFNIENLRVKPMFTVPVAGGAKYNSVRVQMSFDYTFR